MQPPVSLNRAVAFRDAQAQDRYDPLSSAVDTTLGLLGGRTVEEEIESIAPAIADARAAGIDASGPWPGDTVFMRARHFRDFDVVVAMYHDQGLIPVKYLGVDTGVNITVGLPFVRTSVDHGTAFDIAGHGVADHRSLLAAIDLALKLAPEPQAADRAAPAPASDTAPGTRAAPAAR
jgi:hypothetical protein